MRTEEEVKARIGELETKKLPNNILGTMIVGKRVIQILECRWFLGEKEPECLEGDFSVEGD